MYPSDADDVKEVFSPIARINYPFGPDVVKDVFSANARILMFSYGHEGVKKVLIPNARTNLSFLPFWSYRGFQPKCTH